ncbi:MAG: hypothetical protein PW792_01150 [Acidobacteriaceae bacterium]|nr:hypothetical protein [Acidobacteriaceae bacterium]
MLAFIVLILAALTRFLPHTFHGTALNFTAVGAGLLFFGSRRPRWQAVFAVAVMASTDFVLTHFVYSYPFHASSYLVTWFWYAAVCIMASDVLSKVTTLRVAAAIFASATGFFLLSNFAVWVGSGMYPHSSAGLVSCFVSALPFYANDLVSTGLVATVLFGLPALAKQLAESTATAGHAA